LLFLELKAPFAAFRPLQAGTFRSTMPTIPPTTAYGLLLNLAAIDIRDWSKISKSSTPILKKLPKIVQNVEIAIANLGRPTANPEAATLLQQLHNVPVNTSKKQFPPEKWERTKGCKPNIKPIRREILVGFHAVIAVRCSDELRSRIIAGLAGELNQERDYGLPFAGDNNFLFDDIKVASEIKPLYWYTRIEDGELPRIGTCRLTTWIDRNNSANTVVEAFAPVEVAQVEPPDNAWTTLPI
jgi:CRISPR-associated protein Cas5t